MSDVRGQNSSWSEREYKTGKESTERATASFAKKERESKRENEEREMGKRYLLGRLAAHYMGGSIRRFGTRSALMTLG